MYMSYVFFFKTKTGTEPRITLYRDTAGWCPYCEKVWLMLEEKRVPYRVEKVPMYVCIYVCMYPPPR